MDASTACTPKRRLRELQSDHERLRIEIQRADALLEELRIATAAHVSSACVRRQLLTQALQAGLSRRRACRLISAPIDNASPTDLKATILRLRREYPRYGIRRVRDLLACAGVQASKYRCEQIWRECMAEEREKCPPGGTVARDADSGSSMRPETGLDDCMLAWLRGPTAPCEA
jgi:hypothetical protein